jgi:hypothetical protein
MFDLFNESSIMENLNITSESNVIHQEMPENNILLAEAIIKDTLTPDELQALCENTAEKELLFSEGILSEVSIMKFDKAAKLKKYEGIALIAIAREKKDRNLNKLIRIWKMRRFILDDWRKKYGTEAKRRANEMLRNFGKSKSTTAMTAVKRTK